ncbi:MAG TPA: hypothetical protein VHT75_07870 [Acidimicrobiales bacterium]|jgi:hypothetical protein|nr:hypothetical protein [Acidimicrobiales bacterium]
MRHWLRRAAGWRAGDPARGVQLALGLLWLIDGALQFQPYMFSAQFVTQTLEPAANSVPGGAGRFIITIDQFLLPHIGWWNAVFATIQLVIGLGLLWPRTVRMALAGSVVWSLLVWWLGEGFGGIFSSASPLMGWPGAVLLYALLAVLAWPRKERRLGSHDRSVAERSPLGRVGACTAWLLLWTGAAAYLLLPVNRSPGSMESMIASMSEGQPSWVMSMNRALAAVAEYHGTQLSIALAVLCCVVGLSVIVPWDPRPVLIVAAFISLVFWLGEDFGGVFTGSGTDVNTGPLLIILVGTYWRPGRQSLGHLASRLQPVAALPYRERQPVGGLS